RGARRIAVVHQVAPPLQIGIALEHVPVQRSLLKYAARIKQVGALAGSAQYGHGIALADRLVLEHRVKTDVEDQAKTVAHPARAQQRPDEVRAVARTPAAEGLAETLVVLVDAQVARPVEQAEDPDRGIDREPRPVGDRVPRL